MIRVAIHDHTFTLQVLTKAVEITGSTPDVEELVVREVSARLPAIRELSRSKRPAGANLIY